VEPIVYENNNCIPNVEKYCYCVLHKQTFLLKVASRTDICISQSSACLSLLIHSLLIYKENNGSESYVGHHTHNREENITMVRSRQKDSTGEEINYGMDTTGE
jgi:myosin-crossreactive antigen